MGLNSLLSKYTILKSVVVGIHILYYEALSFLELSKIWLYLVRAPQLYEEIWKAFDQGTSQRNLVEIHATILEKKSKVKFPDVIL